MKRVLSSLTAAGILLAAACAQAGKTDNLFTVETKSVPVKAGEKGKAEVQIKVKPEGHISNEAPFKATVTGKNVKLEKDKLAKPDAVYKDGGASAAIPFTAGEKGEGTVEADLTFFMCSKEICERHQRKVSIPVTVQ
ncbi:MAG: hypothetical protein HY901_21330 [Deltaproteobacteria bacterium]|nr:hypothetical protein [Deltaproteobacteria bacterium]